ncbi:MAG: heparinase II/III family protein, partial [Deltaproteobacteria bacterium]|nr:heparinase II/III family protein [Deltaproteobacteria bacterium]
LKPVADRLVARASAYLTAPVLRVSTLGRGVPDPPDVLKGLGAASRIQGRALTLAMAYLLRGERRYRDAAMSELDRAITEWPSWVDTAHEPPYDLMTGEMGLTLGVTYDWLYDVLSAEERTRLREGAERHVLEPYLAATTGRRTPMFWYRAVNNWNPVCNGGATVLAVSLFEESALAEPVLAASVPAMAAFWDRVAPDGGWDEGTGYWTYGFRYAFMAADALRRAGRPEGAAYLARPGARATGNFPLVFNPGTSLSASFGDSTGRAADPLFYFLGREYRNADFVWFQDRVPPRGVPSESWPEEALTLAWRPVDEAWLPEATSGFRPTIPAVTSFPSIGWAMLASAQPDPPLFLAFKSGSLAASHSHLDLNHVSVGVGSQMVLTELGSRPYPADYFGSRTRPGYYEISTAGHNAVLVGGRGQVFGRPGALRGPIEGAGYAELTGVADGAYEVSTPRARRTVVFVDRRYFVVFDEVAPASPAAIELRFHSYGTFAPRTGGWTVTLAGAALDVIPAGPASLAASLTVPAGWIRPVNVLRLASDRPLDRLVHATVLAPRGAAPGAVTQESSGGELRLGVGADRIVFRETPDGYVVARVSTGAR